jgi:uncharacterized SAM-binding protein YcdF (DUF218 family)
MLTSIQCPDSISGSWVSWAGTLSDWLVRPLLVLPLFIVLFGLCGLLPRRRGRRPLRAVVVALSLTYLIGVFPMTVNLAELALNRQIPDDSGSRADAVVILGRGSQLNPSRVEVATQLWQEQRAPLMFASGINDAPEILTMLHDRGIPEQQLQGEDCSRTTYENAEFTASLLKPQGVQRILLVTDGPHMLRSWLTFRGAGFNVTPVSSASLDTLSRTRRTRLVFREYLGLVSYGLLGRFSPNQDAQAVHLTPQPSQSQTAARSS